MRAPATGVMCNRTMEVLDLRLSESLKNWLIEAKGSPEFKLGSFILMKSLTHKDLFSSWSVSIANPETLELTGVDISSVVLIENLEFIVTNPELTHELEGKYLHWNEQGMKLEAQK
ncbi:hypothetical protein R50072_32300 [Simiduia litorea]|uniref:hypothetical protein n=1 Tax=Simiduia litorea TaxID=1435348 RepID=UPI0036F333C4